MACASNNTLWRSLITENGYLIGMKSPNKFVINALSDRPVEQRAELLILRQKAVQRMIAQCVFGGLFVVSFLVLPADGGMAITMALLFGLAYFFTRHAQRSVVTKAWLIWKFPPDSELYVTEKAKLAGTPPPPGKYRH